MHMRSASAVKVASDWAEMSSKCALPRGAVIRHGETEKEGMLFIIIIPVYRIVLLGYTQGESGVATNYISRNQALKKLQLSLPDFR